MRRLVMVFVLALAVGFVSASVDVHNYSVDDEYSPFEILTGDINLTIEGEEYDELITSNDDDEIKLGDFLNASGVLFSCSPPDCSKDYSSSVGVLDKSFGVSASGDSYIGFVLTGSNVNLTSLNFKVSSDFDESSRVPLVIDFFERETWKYEEFSDSLLGKNWGCYDQTVGGVGALIGDALYCEMISVQDSGSLKIGARVSGDGGEILNMSVFPESGTGGSWTCSYNASASDEGCDVSPGLDDVFSGNYQVCVNADSLTGYRIYNESVGDNCGFGEGQNPENSTKDYAIFARRVKYADAGSLGVVSFNDDDFIVAANGLIAERYEGDCSGGCVLPMAVSGVPQNVRIFDVQLVFTENFETDSDDRIYDLDASPVVVDFGGVLDLSALGFSVSKSMDYVVSFGGVKLFDKAIKILPAPIVLSVLPLDPPAGVPIKFYVDVDFDGNKSLSYDWDFGDGVKKSTGVPYVVHSYGSLGNYSMEVEVSAGGDLTSKKSFDIVAVSPEDAVNVTLISKRSALDDFIKDVAEFPSWFGDPLSKFVDVNFFDSELDRLDRARNNSFEEDDFVEVAEELYALDVPSSVFVNSFNSPYLMTDVDDIDIEPVSIIGGGVTGAVNDDYKNPILRWQGENVVANFLTREISVVFGSGETNKIFRTYAIDVESSDYGESYFVINRPFSELFFKDDVGARKVGNSSVIILGDESEYFEFYYKSGDATSFFVSPKLSTIVVEADIDESCDYDFVCEDGEDSDNCRNDCKPVFGIVVYAILAFVFVLIVYSILQLWYKHRYEGHLFKDGRQMYNLLMYVTNARARGMQDGRIAAELRSQGWSSERVNYIIKKSRGQRTGLYEIIPFGKISAFFRNRKARKAEAARVATGAQQQGRRNINKSGFQRRF
jgi:PKD repeat protein